MATLLGCNETSVYLEIHSRLKIPDQLDAACLQLAGSAELEFARRYPLSSTNAGAPLTLSVVAGERNNRAFEVMLSGERRGWQTAWQRTTVRFEDKAIKQVDMHIEGCPGGFTSGDFSGAGRLTASQGTHVAAMPVPYAYGQLVVVWPGGFRRFASLQGTVHEKQGSAPTVGSEAITGMLKVDLDGDCDLDLVLLRAKAQPVVWRNDGNGGFNLDAAGLPGPGDYVDGAAADINRDGAVDLLLAARTRLTLLLGSASKPGTFKVGTGLLPALGSAAISSVAVGLVTDDAHPDIVLGRGGVTTSAANLLLVNNKSGTGSFTAGPTFSRKDPTRAVALADLDGDGLHELVVGNAKGTASFVYQNTRGVLNQKGPWSAPGSAGLGVAHLLVRDLNNDCAADIAMASKGGLRVWSNRGKLTFKAASLGATPPGCTNLDAADVDGDSKLDLVLGGDAQGASWMRQR